MNNFSASNRPGYLAIAPATAVMILVNVAVFVWMGLHGVSWIAPRSADLLGWGGDLPVYTLTGDGWRLATNMFLHAGLVHVGLNMYVLYFTGPRVELEFGTPRMVGIYLGGGLMASCASVFWSNLHAHSLTVSVGASGAVMALFGSLLTLLLMPAPTSGTAGGRPPIDRSLIQVVVINLGLGLLVPNVDQAAHVGGLIGGFLIGVVMAIAPRASGWLSTTARLAATALLTGACVLALLRGADSDELRAVRAQLDEQMQQGR